MSDAEPFKGLSVVFYGSEAPLADFHGTPYTNGQEIKLEGEQAYEFLVQLNRADKEYFERKTLGRCGYRKTNVDIHLPEFGMNGMRIDLGDLTFRSADTIADALDARLPLQAANALRNPDFARAFGMSEDRCRQVLEESRKAVSKFREEEVAYLKEHPEIQSINEYQPASFYTYLASRESFLKCKDCGAVIRELPPKSIEGSVILDGIHPYDTRYQGQPALQDIDLSCIEEYRQPPADARDDSILFQSAYDVDGISSVLRHEGFSSVHPVILKDEVDAVRFLNKNAILEESHSYLANDAQMYIAPNEPPSFSDVDTSCGLDAVRLLMQHYLEPSGFGYAPKETFPERCAVHLRLGDKDFRESFVNSAFLPNPIREAFKERSISDEFGPMKESFCKAWSVLAKYGANDVGVPDVYHQHGFSYPSFEIKDLAASRKELTENFLGGDSILKRYREDKAETAFYYLEYASADPSIDTPEKLMSNTLSHMAQDGLDKRKAKVLLHHLPVEGWENYFEQVGNALLSNNKEIASAFRNARREKADPR